MAPEYLELGGVQRSGLDRLDVSLDVPRRAHPGDRRRSRTVAQTESERDLGHAVDRHVEIRRDRLDAVPDLTLAVAREVAVPEVALGEGRLWSNVAGERSLVEGNPDDDADVRSLGGGEELVLGTLIEDVVDQLDRVDAAGLDEAQNAVGWWSLIETPKKRIFPSRSSWFTASSQSP